MMAYKHYSDPDEYFAAIQETKKAARERRLDEWAKWKHPFIPPKR